MSSDFKDEPQDDCSPLDLVEVAEEVSINLLPKKSRDRYQRMYNEFESWRRRNNKVSLSENTLLAYFSTICELKKPPTLWGYYSMLKSTLYHNHQVDISNYIQLTSFLKLQSEGYRPKKTNVFTEEEMRLFISSAPDVQWLAVKVACIFGLCGTLRTDEFIRINYNDVKMYPNMAHVTVYDAKEKQSRSFTITGDFFQTVKKYGELRPPVVLSNRFFLNYINEKCTNQVIGKNKFHKMPSQIADFLKLEKPERYTSHAFMCRRKSATLIDNTVATMETLDCHEEWPTNVTERYINGSITYKKRLGNLTESAINVKAKKLKTDNSRTDTDETSNNSVISIEYAELGNAGAVHLSPTNKLNEEDIFVDTDDFHREESNANSINNCNLPNVAEFPTPVQIIKVSKIPTNQLLTAE